MCFDFDNVVVEALGEADVSGYFVWVGSFEAAVRICPSSYEAS